MVFRESGRPSQIASLGSFLNGPAENRSTDTKTKMTQNKTSALRRTTKTGCTLVLGAAITLSGYVSAEIENELDELVVSATRLAVEKSETTEQLKVLDLRDLEERSIYDLRSALNDSPGVLSLSTAGETGALGSLLIRGTANSDSQVVVDGLRINDSNGASSNQFLRGPSLNTFGNIELLKGPQGSLYGGNAIGGVLFMETPRGAGDQETKLFLEGGSFDTLNTFLSNSGSSGELSWFLGGGYNGTHNDAANQNYDQASNVMRLEWQQSDSLVIGTTLRVLDQRFEDSAASVNHLDSVLGTIYVDARLSDIWEAKFTLGHYRQNYDLDFNGGFYYTDLDRTSFSTDHRIEVGEKQAFRFGTYVENNDFESFGRSSFGPFSVSDGAEIRYGGYLGWDWQPVSSLLTKATIRWEDYADYGDEITWNLGTAWEPISGTKFTANVGRAYTPPTFLDLFGATTTGSVGNPNLEAQESLGWDIGVEQEYNKDHSVSLSYFHNHLENAIDRSPTFGFPALPPVNRIGNSETNGVEIGLDGAFLDGGIVYRVAWTYLHQSVNDQPDNFANATLEWSPLEKLSLGIGVTYLDERSYGGQKVNSSIIGRVYGRYQLNEAFALHARIENVNDEEYDLFNSGFGTTQGPGLGLFAGLTATF